MQVRAGVDGVLITGLFGVGKSSVAAEFADLLEARDERYAAIDFDRLTWADTGTGEEAPSTGCSWPERLRVR